MTLGRSTGNSLKTQELRARTNALNRATADVEPPFALVDMDAFWANSDDLQKRAAGKPIRVASKSVRCRTLQKQVLDREGFEGTLSFTLSEALWLASHGFDDLLVAYPTTDKEALGRLGRALDDKPGLKLAIMVDSVAHLDLIESAARSTSQPIQVCIDVDAGLWLAKGRIRIGAKRSPVHSIDDAVSLAHEVERRERLRLVGLMAYESQIAGVGDAPPGKPLRGIAVRAMQKRSASELAERRAEIIAAVSAVAKLRFVNGGGTGSVDLTTKESAVTEIAAGSGLFAPSLFSSYSRFDPVPAALFALSVVRKPGPDLATVLGGGYIASGPAEKSRLPQPYLPPGLRLDDQEGAGEVQTPLLGKGARELRPGDRVYFRHAKAGEMCERFAELYLIEDDRITDVVPTYRGEGQTFL